MCAGIGSPGTLAEVLRGYTGDRTAPQRFSDDDVISTGVLPAIPAGLFRRAGGGGERVATVERAVGDAADGHYKRFRCLLDAHHPDIYDLRAKHTHTHA